MKGDPEVIELLNEVLTSELTAINQYFIHFKMCEDWGYHRVAQKKRKESIEEMHHADWVIARILLLDGVPNMQRYFPVKVGENVVEMHQVDLELEIEACARLNRAIKLARDRNDANTAELLQKILESEEEGIDWLETQLHVIGEIGKERYLAEQLEG
ncbi:MAG: bacterioferritin [Sandaracinaceae bacterium]|nr:bacterioferritin [Sandaracinaceae bacterium]